MVISLIVLIAVSLLGVFAMKSIGLSENVAGNTMDKQRSFQAAESTLRYAEWWVSQPAATGPTVNCATTVTSGNTGQLGTMRVCNAALASLDLPWTGSTTYTPPDMVVASGGGLAATNANTGVQDVNYAAAPQLYIQYLSGNANSLKGIFYNVSAAGFGGNANTTSIVQSTYSLVYNNVNFGGL